MPKRTEHPATENSTASELLDQAAADYAAAEPYRQDIGHHLVTDAREDARVDAAETARANRRAR